MQDGIGHSDSKTSKQKDEELAKSVIRLSALYSLSTGTANSSFFSLSFINRMIATFQNPLQITFTIENLAT